MDALECLEVDRHVRRDETALLFELLLSSLLLMTIDSLSKQFPESGALEDFNKHLMGLVDPTQTEEGHTDLGEGTVVKNLVVYLLHANDLADVGLLQ